MWTQRFTAEKVETNCGGVLDVSLSVMEHRHTHTASPGSPWIILSRRFSEPRRFNRTAQEEKKYTATTQPEAERHVFAYLVATWRLNTPFWSRQKEVLTLVWGGRRHLGSSGRVTRSYENGGRLATRRSHFAELLEGTVCGGGVRLSGREGVTDNLGEPITARVRGGVAEESCWTDRKNVI